DPRRTRRRRLRSLLFYGGIVLLLLTVESPIDYWADSYFFVHMIEHILLMFFCPILVVAGAPWVPLLLAVPVSLRRRLGRALALAPGLAPWRSVWQGVTSRWTALVAFNVVMVFWHLPGPFDLAEDNGTVHIWLMHGSFFVTGLFFWLQIIPSRPFHRRASSVFQMGMILGTNAVMFVLAMALSILTRHSWYSAYANVPGVTLSPFADQQLGAAILWVCGDFWAIPALIAVVRRAIVEEGSLSDVVEAMVWRRGDRWREPAALRPAFGAPPLPGRRGRRALGPVASQTARPMVPPAGRAEPRTTGAGPGVANGKHPPPR
ncbi:MAG: cytochrome c oxidase assembly protein, partial [Acidimicrobiales bacterium]